MSLSPGFYSHLFALLGFLALTALLIASARQKKHGPRLIVACLISASWATLCAVHDSLVALPAALMTGVEWLRNLIWLLFLTSLLAREQQPPESSLAAAADAERSQTQPAGANPYTRLVWLVAGLALLLNLAASLPPAWLSPLQLPELAQQLRTGQFVAFIVMALLGLGLIEQVMRHSSPDQRWTVKYLCVGTGSIFAYDFFIYSEGLLFTHLDTQLWQARGFINGLMVPLIAVSAARHSTLNLGIHVSRHITFHSFTIMAAGCYLLAMSAMGYYVRYVGGDWGNLLQILFLFGSGVVLASLLFSHKLRLSLKVLLNKHFYSFKYDYRQQWLDFTNRLANTTGEVPERVCEAMAALVHASGVLLWYRHQAGPYELLARWHTPEPETQPGQLQGELQQLLQFLNRTQWVIDIDEYRTHPDRYEDLQLPSWLLEMPRVWLVVPLVMQGEIPGFVVLRKSDLSTAINWEDRDLLKMAGQQAVIHLAQHQSEIALIEARQFEAYNRLSTYVMHDLKNILAQQSLIVSNADKHKHKPEFVDDVLLTVANSVDRMNRLLRQMKRGMRSEALVPVSLQKILQQVVREHSVRQPVPCLLDSEGDALIETDSSQLANVFGHLIQNAQEATRDDGQVTIELTCDPQHSTIRISDTGCGMDEDFIKERLFKPFDSTKGLTGMGIGAFESRQYILSLGGDIRVTSQPDRGTEFVVTLPTHAPEGQTQKDMDNHPNTEGVVCERK